MLLKLLIILQINSIYSQSYDEDIEFSYPAQPKYPLQLIKKTDLIDFGKFNNCSCSVYPWTCMICYEFSCVNFPTSVDVMVRSFKLKLTSIAVIKRDDLLKLNNVELLEIEANTKLVSLEPGCFRNMAKLRNLSISYSPKLKHLETNVFEGLVNVRMVYLQKNGFLFVTDVTHALSFRYLPRIYLLDMTENMFHEVHAKDFVPMTGSPLKELNMFWCEIEYMHPDFLKPLQNLTNLRLGQNMFNVSTITRLIERSVKLKIPLTSINLYNSGFRRTTPYPLLVAIGNSGIKKINLAKNHFDTLDDDSFPDMPNINTLDLRDCLIEDISSNAFKNLKNLQILQLGENKLLNIPKAAMIPSLQFLNLAGNSNDGFGIVYFTIQEGIFTDMLSLKNLQLSYNRIGSLTNQTFCGLINLEKLNLKNTSLQDIEIGTFEQVPNLLHLNLINNLFPLFMNLSASLFKGLDKLEELLLGGCSIKNLSLTPSLFHHIPKLKYLDLERNGLLWIETGQLLPLTNFVTLNLAENKLNSWTQSNLPPKNIQFVDLQQNKITKITITMISDLLKIKLVLLNENPLICDCSLFPPQLWQHGNTLYSRLNISNFVARCLGPQKWRKKSIMDYLSNLRFDPSQCQSSGLVKSHVVIIATIIVILVIVIGMIKWYTSRFCKKGVWVKNKC